MGRSRYKILSNDNSPYFITSTVVDSIKMFENDAIVKILLDSLKFLIQSNRIQLYGYVIMPDHIHLILSSDKLSKEVRDFKSFTSRQIIAYLKENQNSTILNQLKSSKIPHKKQQHQFWQEGFHPKRISNRQSLIQKLNYIHDNPVRQGLVDDPSIWKYSSYTNYFDQDGILPVTFI